MAGPCVCPAGAWAALFPCSYITLWTEGGSFWEPESPWAGNAAQTFPASLQIQAHWWVLSATCYLWVYAQGFLFLYNFNFASALCSTLLNLQLFWSLYDCIYSTPLHQHSLHHWRWISLVMGFDCGLVELYLEKGLRLRWRVKGLSAQLPFQIYSRWIVEVVSVLVSCLTISFIAYKFSGHLRHTAKGKIPLPSFTWVSVFFFSL